MASVRLLGRRAAHRLPCLLGCLELLSYHSSAMLINTLLSSGTRVGPSLLPDFYAAIAAFLTVAGPP